MLEKEGMVQVLVLMYQSGKELAVRLAVRVLRLDKSAYLCITTLRLTFQHVDV